MLPVFVTGLYCGETAVAPNFERFDGFFVTGLYCGRVVPDAAASPAAAAPGVLPVFVTGLYCGSGKVSDTSAHLSHVLPVFVTGLYCGPDTNWRGRR